MIYLHLFFGFLKVECFSFGGAYGSIPLIRDIVLSYGWFADDELAYMIAVSESTPGPVMVNLATYIGSRQAGFWGAVLATFAVVTPSFIVILLVMAILKTFLKNKYMQAVLRGLKPCIIGIILATGVYMLINNCVPLPNGFSVNTQAVIITVILAVTMPGVRKVTKKKMSPIALILLSAFCGIIVYGI